MNRMLLFFYLLSSLHLYLAPTFAQQDTDLQELVHHVIANHANVHPLLAYSSVLVGVIKQDQSNVSSYGQLSADKAIAIDGHTLFHIGSITKSFTSSLLLAMSADSVLSIHDSISLYLPDSLARGNPYLKGITFYQLATHTSRLPLKANNIPATLISPNAPYANYQIEDLYHFLYHYQPRKNKRSCWRKALTQATFAYSHVGMSLLGHLLEQAGQQSYDELLQRYIFSKANMLFTSTTLQNVPDSLLVAPGHQFSGRVVAPLSYASLPASEALYSNAHDLMQFMQVLMQNDTSVQVLGEIIKEGYVPQYATPTPHVWVGMGWYIIKTNKKKPAIVTHSGRTGGYSNYIAFIPDKKIGVVILSNSTQIVDQLGIDILNALLIKE